MPGPDVIEEIEGFRRGMLAGEQAQMRMMARRWLQVERALASAFDAMAMEIERRRTAGETLATWRLYQLERYRKLLGQVRDEVGRYAAYAQDVIEKEKIGMAQDGAAQAATVLARIYSGAGIEATFAELPVEQIETMTALTSGGPLRRLLDEAWPEAADGMTRALIEATAKGLNPRMTARMMRDGLAQGLTRILTIARTEQLRAWRETTREQYRQSGVVTGYRRIAARQTRTCLACLFADGRVYGLEEPFQDHPNGRCSLVPIVLNMPGPEWQNGRDWFAGQSEDVQRGMMGDRLHAAWKEGRVSFGDIIRTAHSPVWGDHLRVATLGELGIR